MTNNRFDYALVMDRNHELMREVRSARLARRRQRNHSTLPRFLTTLAGRLFGKSELAHG